jgi:hypothetical protein
MRLLSRAVWERFIRAVHLATLRALEELPSQLAGIGSASFLGKE